MGRVTPAAKRWHVGEVREKTSGIIKRHSLAIVLIALSMLLLLFIGWAVVENPLRSPDGFYLLPRDAGDWTGWGTGMGALGTSGALIYAAVKFRSDVEEQRNLRRNREAEARADADLLDVEVGLRSPEEDRRDVSGLVLRLTNRGEESLSNVQVKIPDVSARITSGASAPIPPRLFEYGSMREDEHWTDMEAPPAPSGSASSTLAVRGDSPPKSLISLDIEFDEIQCEEDWTLSLDEDPRKRVRKGRIAVIFDDCHGRTWVRSTEGRGSLQRLWPESFIVENKARH